MSNIVMRCALCGEPMPPGEQMFYFHGYSGPCPKPPLPLVAEESDRLGVFTLGHMTAARLAGFEAGLEAAAKRVATWGDDDKCIQPMFPPLCAAIRALDPERVANEGGAL